MFNIDVATGKLSTTKSVGPTYSTTGPSNVFNITNTVPSHPESECYLWDVFQTCSGAQTEMLRNGTAILRDYIMIGHELANGTKHYY